MNGLDLELIGIVLVRIFEALLVMVSLTTGRWIRDDIRDTGWSLAGCRAVTAIAWIIALVSTGGFVSNTLWLEIGGLLAVLITFLASGLITEAIAEHPAARGMGSEPGGRLPATGGETTSDGASLIGSVDRLPALFAGVVLGGLAFFGRSLPLGADIVLLGWLAARHPVPVVWISLVGIAAGLVVGGLLTADQAPVTIAAMTVGILCLAVGLRRLAHRPDATPALPTARPQRKSGAPSSSQSALLRARWARFRVT